MRPEDRGEKREKGRKGEIMNIKTIEVVVVHSDITELDVDAIVNLANMQMTMERGLAVIIKKWGGEAIEEEALSKAPVDLGEAIATKAGEFKARHVIHAVTTGVDGGTDQETVRHATLGQITRTLSEIGGQYRKMV